MNHDDPSKVAQRAVTSFDAWWAETSAAVGDPFEVASSVAARADRLAWVFASGYHGALRSLFGVSPETRAALCVTEDDGNTPSAIASMFRDEHLTGTKSFVTFGDRAETLLVLASRGEVDGQKDLVIVEVAADAGVIEGNIDVPFMPEISHARICFDAAPATLLVEDAWPTIKAFRYVEDVFVLGATLSYLAALFDSPILAAHRDNAANLAALDPASPAAHIAYDDLHHEATAAIDGLDWTDIAPDIAQRWQRDRKVLTIASRARLARARKARELVS